MTICMKKTQVYLTSSPLSVQDQCIFLCILAAKEESCVYTNFRLYEFYVLLTTRLWDEVAS
jgi:hypothetical protein